MKESVYKSYDDLPLFLNSATVAKVLGVSPSSGYELMHEPGFPVLRIGNRMVVPKEQFIQWVKEHTGRWCMRYSKYSGRGNFFLSAQRSVSPGSECRRVGGVQFPETV